MSSHIIILDIGKTNKKAFVFDQDYHIVFEHSQVLEETTDEDGTPCENIMLLTSWMSDQILTILEHQEFNIKAINFSAYGASLVFLNSMTGTPVTPLYNYLKPIDQQFKDQFFLSHGGELNLCLETASPSLGLLNSGLQLYRLKEQLETEYKKTNLVLHLPQYCSYVFSHIPYTEITSLGCHTMLWHFKNHDYHQWIKDEGIDIKLPAIQSATHVTNTLLKNNTLMIGTGLHDSSAALIPYLKSIDRPFILLSTGTWCIAFNPFNDHPLTSFELKQDCLCYLTYEGQAVKASRLFSGHEYDEQVARLSRHFAKESSYFQSIAFDSTHLSFNGLESDFSYIGPQGLWCSGFEKRNWFEFKTPALAYHVLLYDLVKMQKKSIRLIQNQVIQELYVDGGFSKNLIYMHLLAIALPDLKVYSAKISQASAIGAAMVIHSSWNAKELPTRPVEFRYFNRTEGKF